MKWTFNQSERDRFSRMVQDGVKARIVSYDFDKLSHAEHPRKPYNGCPDCDKLVDQELGLRVK